MQDGAGGYICGSRSPLSASSAALAMRAARVSGRFAIAIQRSTLRR